MICLPVASRARRAAFRLRLGPLVVLLVGGCLLACAPSTDSRCGDGVLGIGEACDDGNQSSTDLCTNACRVAACGDGFVQPGEACDDGAGNSDERSGACRTTCQVFTCGDDVTDDEHGEECDYGDDNSDLLPNACRVGCTFPRCGDMVVDQGEQCDDGNTNPGDSCDACVLSTCGNGRIEPGEGCDDGNRLSGDGCSGACFLEAAACGDGIVQGGVESCDDGNRTPGDCCDADCHAESGCEREPNDLPLGSPTFESLAVAGGVDALIFPADDEDVYPFTIAAGQRLALKAYTLDGPLGSTCASLAIESELELWRLDVPLLPELIASDYGPGRCSVVRATGLGAGSYMLKVRAWPFDPVSFDYRLQLERSPVLIEAEPNDALATTLPLFETGSLVEADLGPDADWFRFELVLPTDLRVATWSPPGPGYCATGLRTRLQLHRADGTLIAADSAGGPGYCSSLDARGRAEVRSLPAGIYYVAVTDEGTPVGARRYVLDISKVAECGDGEITGTETCDDGNAVGGDGCSATCRRE